ncbi:Protein of unknown function [Pyronema omphalodes CBS 100304]|uniref:Uncharacterized protein n=1 Tax=Pyronema omphalodes (strain CBS 100304) TaxID=1076935 RepID=U4L8R2_PYROM|nr:Protein of unknown function [Pyronema omphalodes CBS 100304]
MNTKSLLVLVLSCSTAVLGTPGGKWKEVDEDPDVTSVILFPFQNFQWEHSFFRLSRHKSQHVPCVTLEKNWRKNVESYKVKNGCCEFYKDLKCQEHLFAANNREDKVSNVITGGVIYAR